ncbi:hypothetical protein HYX12_02410 [Candidatus Woesearchaeota archaeon]|nr:hypothetical protein [Candidatus Woesearchaeota archaeon]
MRDRPLVKIHQAVAGMITGLFLSAAIDITFFNKEDSAQRQRRECISHHLDQSFAADFPQARQMNLLEFSSAFQVYSASNNLQYEPGSFLRQVADAGYLARQQAEQYCSRRNTQDH